MAIAHTRAGSGEPLVLIHGLGGTRRIWQPVIDRVAAERDVVAVDLPGFGASPPLPADVPATAANLGAAVGDLCAELGLDRPHLAGNSLGGWAALELAKAGRAASVCAISPAGLWRRPLGPRSSDARSRARWLRPILPVLRASRRARSAALRNIVARPERLSRADARALIRDWLDGPGYEAANREMRSHVFEDPELVPVPATIAWGTEDRLVGRPRRERMPPGARYVEPEGLGHTPTWDDPRLIAELLLESSGGGQAASAQSVGAGRSSPGH
jgi:pimeloyl-ACP methyl ester carboxylesterase